LLMFTCFSYNGQVIRQDGGQWQRRPLSLALIANDESHVCSSPALTDRVSIITTETDPMMSPSWPCSTADGHQRKSWFLPCTLIGRIILLQC